MSGIINREAIKERLWPGIESIFGMTYADYEPQWGYTYDTERSSKAYEEYVMESGFGLAPAKVPGAATAYDTGGDVWKGRVENVSYGLAFVITREAVEDNQYEDMVPKYTRALKRSMVQTKEVRCAAFQDGVFTTSMTGDGKPVCASDHPLKSGDTWSNLGPAADLNETSLEAALIQIGDWTDERGLRVNVRALRLIVPNGQQFTARRLLGSTLRPGTADNDINATKDMGMLPGGYAVNNYLTDRSAWYIKTDVQEGMTFWDRTPLDVEPGEGIDHQVLKAVAFERWAISCRDPRGFFGQPGQPLS